jgi:hypothetical protein
MSDKSGKLATFLREVSSWTWEEFVIAEHNDKYTSNQAIIFALIRSCAMQKLPAIKVAISRLDGKLVTPIKIEYPKVFYLYPHASPQEKEAPADIEHPMTVERAEAIVEGIEGELMPVPQPIEQDEKKKKKAERNLPSMSFRETLTEMSDYPRSLPQQIVDLALQTEQALRQQAERPDEIPMVKSVVAAHLLIMAQSRNLDAMGEVFDQIDGKLVETIKILGEDIYLTMFGTEAPPGAKLNDDGIYQIEGTISQNIWAEKLGKAME